MAKRYVYNKDNPQFTYLVEFCRTDANVFYLHPFWSTTSEDGSTFTPVMAKREGATYIGTGWEKLKVTQEQLEKDFCWEDELNKTV